VGCDRTSQGSGPSPVLKRVSPRWRLKAKSGAVMSKRILIVDDDPLTREMAVELLSDGGHDCVVAEDGRQGLAVLNARPVDLVLLDIEMPEMNGYQTLEALRADPKLRDIPVVMMSSVDEVDSVARCIEMGAEDYLFKPVNAILLRARVAASLEKKRLRDQQRELFRKFATAEVAEELLTTGLALGGKYVDATVMFSDIRSFTSLVESRGPEETIELLNSYYTLMFDAIGGHGGIVNQMEGDGLMALFGAPLPHADHTERAVRAGLDMLELVAGFNREQAVRRKPEIRIGIGIASGQVIAGYTGTERRVTYTCVGDPVNLAAHLEAHTKVVGRPILIDEHTRATLGDSIQVEDHGPAQFKTRAQPVRIYSVVPVP
jgi:adenylate cyclase